MIKQIWLYVAISVAPQNPGHLNDYREFGTFPDCQKYAAAQPYRRNQAAECIPAIKDTRRAPLRQQHLPSG